MTEALTINDLEVVVSWDHDGYPRNRRRVTPAEFADIAKAEGYVQPEAVEGVEENGPAVEWIAIPAASIDVAEVARWLEYVDRRRDLPAGIGGVLSTILAALEGDTDV